MAAPSISTSLSPSDALIAKNMQNLGLKLNKQPLLYTNFMRCLCRLVDYTKTTKQEAKVVVKHDLYRIFKKCGLLPGEYPSLGLINVADPNLLYNWLELVANMWFYAPREVVTNRVSVAPVVDTTPMFELVVMVMTSKKPCDVNTCTVATIVLINIMSAMNHPDHTVFLPAITTGRVCMLKMIQLLADAFCAYYDCPDCSVKNKDQLISLAMYTSAVLGLTADLLKVPAVSKDMCIALRKVVMEQFHMVLPILTTLHKALLSLPVVVGSQNRQDARDGLTNIIRCFALCLMCVKTKDEAATLTHNEKFVKMLFSVGIMDILTDRLKVSAEKTNDNDALVACYMLLSQMCLVKSIRNKMDMGPLFQFIALAPAPPHNTAAAFWLMRALGLYVADDEAAAAAAAPQSVITVILRELSRHKGTTGTEKDNDTYMVWTQGLNSLILSVTLLSVIMPETQTAIRACLGLLPPPNVTPETMALVSQLEHLLAHKPVFTKPVLDIVPVQVVKKCSFADCQKTAALQLCSQCKTVRYCDSACQRGDWAHHKPVCRAVAAAAVAAAKALYEAKIRQRQQDNAADLAATEAAAEAASEADPTNDDWMKRRATEKASDWNRKIHRKYIEK